MEAAELVFDGSDERALTAWVPPCVERVVPGYGTTWVHGYTGADVGRWRHLARNLTQALPALRGPDGQPGPEALRIAQVVLVCRRGPGSAAMTFSIQHGGEAQACSAFQEALPGKWVEQVCADSDALTLVGYHPSRDLARGTGPGRALSEALADPAFWSALDHLSLRLYGARIAENGAPLAEVLAMMERDAEARVGLLAALAPLAALVG